MRIVFYKIQTWDGLTHAGTSKTVMATFDNRNPSENPYESGLQKQNQVGGVNAKRTLGICKGKQDGIRFYQL